VKLHRILLDMDGVLVNFAQGVMDIFGETVKAKVISGEWSIGRWLYVSDDYLWQRIGEDPFWINLHAYSWARYLFDTVREFGPTTIATSPSSDPSSAQQKIEWLQDWMGFDFRNFMIGPDKAAMARPDSILIDDSDSNVTKFCQAGGNATLFPQPWNSCGLSAYQQFGEKWLDRLDAIDVVAVIADAVRTIIDANSSTGIKIVPDIV